MKQSWALLLSLLLGACASRSHDYLNPTRVNFGGSAETWDATAVAGLHVHPLVGSDCRELARLIHSGAAAAPRPEVNAAAGQMAAAVESLIAQTHGTPYGGPGKILLHLRHFAEGRLEPDRSVFVVVPDLRPEDQERSFDDAAIQAALHEGDPKPSAVLDVGTVHVSRRSPGRLAFKVRVDIGNSRLEADVEAEVWR